MASNVSVEFIVTVNPDELVEYLDHNDDRVFTFISDMLDNEKIGVEVKERLFEHLKDELKK